MENKIRKRYVYDGLGVCVILQNVTMVKVRGKWAPEIDINKLSKALFEALPYKESRLTGDEIRFIRHYCNMTLQDFGNRFDVSHAAVKKWEDYSDKCTKMTWTTEKDIRLFILTQTENIDAKDFKQIYEKFSDIPKGRIRQPRYDSKQALCIC